MRTRTFVITAVAIGALGYAATMTSAPAQTTAPAPTTSEEARYELDPVHSSIVFGITHLGVSMFYGRVNSPGGKFTFDADDPGTATFEIKAKMDSLDTGNSGRDKDVKGADFFNAKEFPEITFKSTSLKKQGRNYQLAGNLTLHGVTKAITADLEHIGTKDTKFGHRCGFNVSFKIKRSDFGVTHMADLLGDDITVFVGLEGKGK